MGRLNWRISHRRDLRLRKGLARPMTTRWSTMCNVRTQDRRQTRTSAGTIGWVWMIYSTGGCTLCSLAWFGPWVQMVAVGAVSIARRRKTLTWFKGGPARRGQHSSYHHVIASLRSSNLHYADSLFFSPTGLYYIAALQVVLSAIHDPAMDMVLRVNNYAFCAPIVPRIRCASRASLLEIVTDPTNRLPEKLMHEEDAGSFPLSPSSDSVRSQSDSEP
jgi:hypothetical protein